MLCISSFVDNIMFADNGPYGAWLIGHTLKVAHWGQQGVKCDVCEYYVW